MAQTISKQWNDGSGQSLTVRFSGSGNGTITVSSPANEGAERLATLRISTVDDSVVRTLTVTQPGIRERLYDSLDSLLTDSGDSALLALL